MTKKEMKKMRKIRRQAELQDRQDRIRMGLIPPDPPKVKLSNLMRVLTSDAVQDPTKVEARVRREVAMRKHGHEKMNKERKLTDDQRKEKIENKKVQEEQKGLVGALFKYVFLYQYSLMGRPLLISSSPGSKLSAIPLTSSKFERTQIRTISRACVFSIQTSPSSTSKARRGTSSTISDS